MKKRKLKHLLRRTAFAALAVLWCFVASAAYGFHHHDHGEEECEHSDCPFLQFSFHLPSLPLAAPVLPAVTVLFPVLLPMAVPRGVRLSVRLSSRAPPALPA